MKKIKPLRCRYSQIGLAHLRVKQRYGYIVGYGIKNGYPRVNWDGLSPKTIYSYHPKFIVQDEENNQDNKKHIE